MTYEPWKNNEYLIRFEHIMDKTDDPQLSLPYSFNISEIFPGNFQFTEMNLAANQRIEEVNRLHFRQEGGQRSVKDSVSSNTIRALTDSELVITLNPMQIRTFIMSPTAVTTSSSSAQTVQPTPAPTAAPTNAPTSPPSGVGAVSQNVFKLFPFIIIAMILRNVF